MKPYRRLSASNLITLGALCTAGLFASAWWDQRQQQHSATRSTHTSGGYLAAPVFREMVTAHGNLLEMRVPVDPLQTGASDVQICYVWRDATSGSASLSCPGETVPNIAPSR
jgi:hypothetical protein